MLKHSVHKQRKITHSLAGQNEPRWPLTRLDCRIAMMIDGGDDELLLDQRFGQPATNPTISNASFSLSLGACGKASSRQV